MKNGRVEIETRSNEVWKGHDDGSRVNPFLFPVLIVGTKYDALRENESEPLKWLCRAIRYFAH